MNDLISRQAAIEALRRAEALAWAFGYHNVIGTIRDLPTIDPVVRCKDCRWREREQPGMVYCPNTVGNWVEDDWYCADGERREG